VGFGVWSYHARIIRGAEESQGVLSEPVDLRGELRGELRRVYEYIISGISLIAAAAGLMMVLVAILESLTPGEVVSTTSSTNTLLVAITLILVGSPVWWFFWQRIEGHVAVDGLEQSSPTRRIFLLMLFGVASVASVVSVLTGVFLFLDDLLNDQLGYETLRQARFAIAILLSNAAIAWYHWSIYRHERSISVRKAKHEKFVVLVGPRDPDLAREVESEIDGKVQMWDSQIGGAVDGEIAWEKEKVIELIKAATSDEIMIINEKKKLRAIPFQRN
jgi:hypothetical protein